MMTVEQSKLINELRNLTQAAITQVTEFKTYPIEQLNFKLNDADWSVLECIEHLCLYGKFYLPEIEKRIANLEPLAQKNFKSGFLGNYFVNLIKSSNAKKIKATKQMDPTGSSLSMATLDKFIKQLRSLDLILVKSMKIDLAKVKTAISLSRIIKLRLGDTLRFLVLHNERHILQAKRINTKPPAEKIQEQ